MGPGRDDDWLEELRDLAPADPPEPWADSAPAPGELTDEQRAFLEGLEDTPPIPRLRELDPEDGEGPPAGEDVPGADPGA